MRTCTPVIPRESHLMTGNYLLHARNSLLYVLASHPSKWRP